MSIPTIPVARGGMRPGLTFRVPIGGVMRDCMTLPTTATTGKVWVIVDGVQVMELPLFGPEGVMDVGMILLDDWHSMCFAARHLATRYGMDPGNTAPLWYRASTDDRWILERGTPNGMGRMCDAYIFMSDIPDAAFALAAAINALN